MFGFTESKIQDEHPISLQIAETYSPIYNTDNSERSAQQQKVIGDLGKQMQGSNYLFANRRLSSSFQITKYQPTQAEQPNSIEKAHLQIQLEKGQQSSSDSSQKHSKNPQNTRRLKSTKDVLDAGKQEIKYSQSELRIILKKSNDYRRIFKVLAMDIQKLRSDKMRLSQKIRRQYEQTNALQIRGLHFELQFQRGKAIEEKIELQKKLKDSQARLKKVEMEKNRLKEELSQMKKMNQMNAQQFKEKYESQIGKLENEVRLIKKELSLQEQKLKQKDQMQISMRKKNETNEVSLMKAKSENQKLESLLKQNEMILQSQKEKVNEYEKEMKKLKANFQQLQNQNKQVTRQKEKMQAQLKNQMKIKDEKNKMLSKQIQKLTKGKQTLEKDKASLQAAKTILQRNMKILEDSKRKIQQDRRKLEEVNIKLEKQAQNHQRERMINLEDIDRLRSELESYKKDNVELNRFKNMAKTHLNLMQQSIGLDVDKKQINEDHLQQIHGKLIRYKYFNDSIILPKLRLHKTQFIVHQLKNFLKVSTFSPELLYRFDPLNPTNFHRYFDNKNNLLTIIELTNGAVIGGLTVHPFDQNRVEKPGSGFIFSITSEKVFKMRPEPRLPVNSYDAYYFLLGNAQIRLRSQQKKVFSNFGIANSTFDNAGEQRTKFLNASTGDNELDIETYQFYHLMLEQ